MMEIIETNEIRREVQALHCDRCKVRVTPDNVVEWQEFRDLGGTGGYGSVFGDGAHFHCDLCQSCLKAVIAPWLWYSDADGNRLPDNGNEGR